MAMTEAKWLKRATPGELIDYLAETDASPRKLRLFAVACCRLSKQKYANPDEAEEERNVLDVAERFADGLATAKALSAVYHCRVDADSGSTWIVAEADADSAAVSYSQADRMDCRQREKAALIRDVFGNPFRPVAFDPKWRGGAVASLAQAAYDERLPPRYQLDPVRLSILADALEELGCPESTIMDHLRAPEIHMRGCWALDLVLGKK